MGPKRTAAMLESGVETVGDILYRLPLRYVDRSVITPLGKMKEYIDSNCTVSGVVEAVRFEKGRKPRFIALLTDNTGSVELIWFRGLPYYRKTIRKGMRLVVSGKTTFFKTFQMVHPVVEILSASTTSEAVIPILPLYGLTDAMREAGIGQQFMRNTIRWIFDNCRHFPQTLPQNIEKRRNLPSLAESLLNLHFPRPHTDMERFKERLKFEELYRLAISLHHSRRSFFRPGRPLSAGGLAEQFIGSLPFSLTHDQKSAIDTLLADIASPRRMHRLLQGDVGSGKTVVAFCAALPSLNEGLQVVWMTPTEVLARQTWKRINEWLQPLGYSAELLVSSLKSGGNHEIRRRIASGEVRFVVGTHALLQPSVTFHNVGIFIIDEQHRFGARQRLMLHEKDRRADFLLMSATPIPQTLAQTLYSDLDLAAIRSLPPGRQPVATHIVPNSKRSEMERFIRERIASGSKCYYIVPRIEKNEDEEEATNQLHDLETTFAELTGGVFRGIPAAYIHGKLDNIEKERILEDFSSGKILLLVATSVLEVGVDVPEASVIVIENSERFGLAQLHQLRGRVGRGREKSYCFLLTSDQAGTGAIERLKTFCKEHNGFEVAELDLKLRGPGEVAGYKQSGWDDLLYADIIRDAKLFADICREIEK